MSVARGRVIHVVPGWERQGDEADDAGLLACARAVRECEGWSHRVLLIGSSAGAARARGLGLVPTARIAPVGRSLPMARRAIARYLAARARPGTVIQCWHEGIDGVVRRAAPGELPVATFRPGEDAAPTPMIVPGVPAGGDGVVRVGLIADPPGAGDAFWFATVVGLVTLGYTPVVGVAGSGSGGAARAMRSIRTACERWRVEFVEESVLCHAPRLSAALVAPARGSAPSRGRWALRTVVASAHLAGVPVIAPASAGLDGLYPGEAAARCLASHDRPSAAGLLLARLLREPREGQREALRAHAERIAADGGFAARLTERWDGAIRVAAPAGQGS